MFRPILLSSFLAGLLASLALTLAQALWVSPLILQAETYEEATTPSGHEHGDEAWQPENGWQRTLATASANAALGLGYGLMLGGLFALRRPSGPVQGMAWGLAGYAVFFAAPSLGLPPELPGTAAAELGARQQWWLGTALATALGLGLLFLQRQRLVHAAGLLLMAAPHLIGAPHPVLAASLAPEELQMRFRLATLACNALFWLALGVLSALGFRSFSSEADS